jgi:hypothetical protein
LLGLSALAFGAVGFASPSFGLVSLSRGLGGVLLGAESSGLIALAAGFYVTVIRSSGPGWATAVGRFGSFTLPLVAAMLLDQHRGIGRTGAGGGGVRAAAGVGPDAVGWGWRWLGG